MENPREGDRWLIDRGIAEEKDLLATRKVGGDPLGEVEESQDPTERLISWLRDNHQDKLLEYQREVEDGYTGGIAEWIASQDDGRYMEWFAADLRRRRTSTDAIDALPDRGLREAAFKEHLDQIRPANAGEGWEDEQWELFEKAEAKRQVEAEQVRTLEGEPDVPTESIYPSTSAPPTSDRQKWLYDAWEATMRKHGADQKEALELASFYQHEFFMSPEWDEMSFGTPARAAQADEAFDRRYNMPGNQLPPEAGDVSDDFFDDVGSILEEQVGGDFDGSPSQVSSYLEQVAGLTPEQVRESQLAGDLQQGRMVSDVQRIFATEVHRRDLLFSEGTVSIPGMREPEMFEFQTRDYVPPTYGIQQSTKPPSIDPFADPGVPLPTTPKQSGKPPFRLSQDIPQIPERRSPLEGFTQQAYYGEEPPDYSIIGYHNRTAEQLEQQRLDDAYERAILAEQRYANDVRARKPIGPETRWQDVERATDRADIKESGVARHQLTGFEKRDDFEKERLLAEGTGYKALNVDIDEITRNVVGWAADKTEVPAQQLKLELLDYAMQRNAEALTQQYEKAFDMMRSEYVVNAARDLGIDSTGAISAWARFRSTGNMAYLDDESWRYMAFVKFVTEGNDEEGQIAIDQFTRLSKEMEESGVELASSSVDEGERQLKMEGVDELSQEKLAAVADFVVGERKVSKAAIKREFGLKDREAERFLDSLESKGIVSKKNARGRRTLTGDETAARLLREQFQGKRKAPSGFVDLETDEAALISEIEGKKVTTIHERRLAEMLQTKRRQFAEAEAEWKRLRRKHDPERAVRVATATDRPVVTKIPKTTTGYGRVRNGRHTGELGFIVGAEDWGGQVGKRTRKSFENPFHGQKDQAKKYRAYLWREMREDPDFLLDVRDLAGRHLVCPGKAGHKDCHAVTLGKAADWAYENFDAEGRYIGSEPDPFGVVASVTETPPPVKASDLVEAAPEAGKTVTERDLKLRTPPALEDYMSTRLALLERMSDRLTPEQMDIARRIIEGESFPYQQIPKEVELAFVELERMAKEAPEAAAPTATELPDPAKYGLEGPALEEARRYPSENQAQALADVLGIDEDEVNPGRVRQIRDELISERASIDEKLTKNTSVPEKPLTSGEIDALRLPNSGWFDVNNGALEKINDPEVLIREIERVQAASESELDQLNRRMAEILEANGYDYDDPEYLAAEKAFEDAGDNENDYLGGDTMSEQADDIAAEEEFIYIDSLENRIAELERGSGKPEVKLHPAQVDLLERRWNTIEANIEDINKYLYRVEMEAAAPSPEAAQRAEGERIMAEAAEAAGQPEVPVVGKKFETDEERKTRLAAELKGKYEAGQLGITEAEFKMLHDHLLGKAEPTSYWSPAVEDAYAGLDWNKYIDMPEKPPIVVEPTAEGIAQLTKATDRKIALENQVRRLEKIEARVTAERGAPLLPKGPKQGLFGPSPRAARPAQSIQGFSIRVPKQLEDMPYPPETMLYTGRSSNTAKNYLGLPEGWAGNPFVVVTTAKEKADFNKRWAGKYHPFFMSKYVKTQPKGYGDVIWDTAYAMPYVAVSSPDEASARYHEVLWRWAEANPVQARRIAGDIAKNTPNLYIIEGKQAGKRSSDVVVLSEALAAMDAGVTVNPGNRWAAIRQGKSNPELREKIDRMAWAMKRDAINDNERVTRQVEEVLDSVADTELIHDKANQTEAIDVLSARDRGEARAVSRWVSQSDEFERFLSLAYGHDVKVTAFVSPKGKPIIQVMRPGAREAGVERLDEKGLDAVLERMMLDPTDPNHISVDRAIQEMGPELELLHEAHVKLKESADAYAAAQRHEAVPVHVRPKNEAVAEAQVAVEQYVDVMRAIWKALKNRDPEQLVGTVFESLDGPVYTETWNRIEGHLREVEPNLLTQVQDFISLATIAKEPMSDRRWARVVHQAMGAMQTQNTTNTSVAIVQETETILREAEKMQLRQRIAGQITGLAGEFPRPVGSEDSIDDLILMLDTVLDDAYAALSFASAFDEPTERLVESLNGPMKKWWDRYEKMAKTGAKEEGLPEDKGVAATIADIQRWLHETRSDRRFREAVDYAYSGVKGQHSNEVYENLNALEQQLSNILTAPQVRDTELATMVPASEVGLTGDYAADYLIDRTLGTELSKAIAMSRHATSDANLRHLLNTAHSFWSWWKRAATIARPSFHIRNFIGGMYNNMLIGVTPASYFRLGPDTLKFQHLLDAAKPTIERLGDAGEEVFYRDVLTHLKPENRQLFYNVWKSGILDTAFSRGDLGHMPGRTWLKPWKSNWVPFQVGGKTMESVEGVLRVAAFAKYFDPDKPYISSQLAKTMVNTVHFDYVNLMPLEEKIKKYVPFFVWSRRNIPLQIRMMLQSPRYMIGVNRAKRLWNEQFDESDGSGDAGFITPYSRRNNLGWSKLMWMPDLPMMDLFDAPLFTGQQLGVTPFGTDVRNPQKWALYGLQLAGPMFTIPHQLLDESDRTTNAPAGVNELLLLANGLTGQRQNISSSGDVKIPWYLNAFLDTAIPFYHDYRSAMGWQANNPYRAAREGVLPGEQEMFGYPGQNMLLGEMRTFGRGLGFNWYTPMDQFFANREVERMIDEISMRIRMSLPEGGFEQRALEQAALPVS